MFKKFGQDLPESLVDAVKGIMEAAPEPAKPDAEAIARRKRLQALKDKQEDDAAETSYKKETGVRKVQGSAYGGAKQKDDEVNEEVEDLDELSKGTLDSYLGKSIANRDKHEDDIINTPMGSHDNTSKSIQKLNQRKAGIALAAKKMAKEEVEDLDEIFSDDEAKAQRDDTIARARQAKIKDNDRKYKNAQAAQKRRALDRARSAAKLSNEEVDIVEFVEALNEMDEYEIDEVINEVLGKDASAGDWIKDFTQSDNPKFKGKSKAQRKKMALAAYYGKQRNEELKGNQHKIDANKNGKVDAHDFKLLRAKKKVSEDIEDLDELSKGTLGSYVKKAAQSAAFGRAKSVDPIFSKSGQEKGKAQEKKRLIGISKAVDKMAKEELELVLDLTEGKYDDVPFDPDKKPKKSAVAGKQGYGPSAARHLARLGLKGAEKKKKDETYMGKAATSEETEIDETFYNKNTHADMPASYYIAKHPEGKGPIGGHGKPLAHTTHGAQKDKAIAAAKATGGKAYHVYGGKETEIKESRGHKIIAKKLADIDRRSSGIAPDYHDNAQSISDKLKDQHNTNKVEIVTQKDTSASSQKPDMSHMDDKQDLNKKRHGYGNVVHSEETEIDEATRIKDTQGGYNLKKGSKQSATDRKDAASVVKDFRAKWRAKGRSTKRYDTDAQMDKETGFSATKEEVELDETASLDQYIKSMGYDPEHTPKDKKVMFSKTNAFKTWAASRSRQESKSPGQEDDVHMSPGATARG